MEEKEQQFKQAWAMDHADKLIPYTKQGNVSITITQDLAQLTEIISDDYVLDKDI